MALITFPQAPTDVGDDPFTAFFNRDWAALGGWSLFVLLIMFFFIGFFRGWWVPGWMYREQGKTLAEAMKQNSLLLNASEIVKHFFEATTPPKRKRGDPDAQ